MIRVVSTETLTAPETHRNPVFRHLQCSTAAQWSFWGTFSSKTTALGFSGLVMLFPKHGDQDRALKWLLHYDRKPSDAIDRLQSIKQIGTIYHKASRDQKQFKAETSVFISFTLNKYLHYLNCTSSPPTAPWVKGGKTGIDSSDLKFHRNPQWNRKKHAKVKEKIYNIYVFVKDSILSQGSTWLSLNVVRKERKSEFFSRFTWLLMESWFWTWTPFLVLCVCFHVLLM